MGIDKINEAWEMRRSNPKQAHNIITAMMAETSIYQHHMLYNQCLTVLGILQIYDNNFELAVETLLKASNYYDEHMDVLFYSRNANNLGMVYMILGDYSNAITTFIKGLEVSKPNHIDEMTIFMLYNISEIYKDTDNFNRAIPLLLEAIELNINNSHILSGAVLSSLALCYQKCGNDDLSLEYVTTSIEISELENDDYTLGLCYLVSAMIMNNRQNYELAKDYAYKSIKCRTRVNDQFALANSYLVLSRIALNEGNYKDTIDWGTQALNLANTLNTSVVLDDIYSLLGQANSELHNYKKAVTFYKLLQDEQKKIFNENLKNNLSIITAEQSIINIKKDAEIFRLNNIELKRKNNQISLIGQIGQSLVNALDFDILFRHIYERISEFMDAPIMAIGSLDDHFNLHYDIIIYNHELLPSKSVSYKDESMGLKAIKEKNTLYVEDYDEEITNFMRFDTLEERIPVRSLLFCPLFVESRPIGVLTVQSFKKDAYSEESIKLLKGLSSYIAIAIDNANKASIISKTAKALEETVSALHQTQKQLIKAETLASMGKLVSGVAHELNTPIGSSLTMVTYAQKENSKIENALIENNMSKNQLEAFFTKNAQALSHIEFGIKQASEMITSFKSLAVTESSLVLKSIDAENLLEYIYANNQQFLDMNNITVIKETNCKKIETYPDIINEIYTQFISNSMHHGLINNLERTIYVKVICDEDCITYHYKDSGDVIPPAVATFMFDPFFGTKKHDGLMGIGLHTVHNMVTQILKGTICYHDGEFLIQIKH